MKKFIVLLFFVLIQTSYSQWEACNNGLKDLHVYSFISSDSNLFVGNRGDSTFSGIYYSSNNGNNWTAKNNGLPTYNIDYTLAKSGNNIFAGTINGLYYSSDNGNNWTAKNVASSVLSLATNGNYIFAGTSGEGVFLSTDNGNTWTAKNNGFTNNEFIYMSIFSLAISGNNIFGGADDDEEYGKIFFSTDNGDNWTVKNGGFPLLYVISYKIIENNIYAFTGDGVYISTDYGDNWIKNDVLSNMGIESIAIIGNNMFAYGFKGVFFSADNGNTWISKNSGLPNIDIFNLVISGNYIFAGTFDGGVFRALLSDITNVDDNLQNQNSIQLYPNPVTDYLYIKSSNLNPIDKIQIFSTLGIKVFESEYRDKIDVSKLAPGLYILKIGDKINKFIKM